MWKILFVLIIVNLATLRADKIAPAEYLTPSESIRLSAEKSTPHKATGAKARFVPGKDQVVSAHRNGEVILWNLSDKSAVWRKVIDETGVYSLEVSPQGIYVFVAGNNGKLVVLKAADGSQIGDREIVRPGESFRMTAAKNAPLLAFAGGLRRTDLSWQFYETKGDFEFTDQGSDRIKDSAMSTGIAASPDGKRVALSNAYVKDKFITHYTLDVYDTASNEQVLKFQRPEDFEVIAISPDLKSIAFWGGARDPRVLLLDVESKTTKDLHPDLDFVRKLAFTGDGKYVIATGPREKFEGKPAFYLRMFEAATGKFAYAIAPRSLQPGADTKAGVMDFDVNLDSSKIAVAISDGEGNAGLPDLLVFDLLKDARPVNP